MSDSPVIDLFKENDLVKVCAPMVRYSKLAFRTLVRKYSCQLCFTPMIIADSFIRSSKARNVEFITNKDDRPLIVQFAAKDSNELGKAAEIVANYSDGVDLNCGCPQHWAMKDGYGAELLKTPHLIRDMVLQVKNRIPGPYTVSVKLRILEDMRKNIDLCRTLENAGVSFITVHARTPIQRNQAINVDALREIKNSIGVPLIANGDVKSLFGAEILQKKCGCNGVMVARGILTNPAMFSGWSSTPLSCVQDWVTITSEITTTFQCFHHHLVFMMEKILPKQKRLIFNVLKSKDLVLDFLRENGFITTEGMNSKLCSTIHCEYGYNDEGEGSYFKENLNNSVDGDMEDYIEDTNLFTLDV